VRISDRLRAVLSDESCGYQQSIQSTDCIAPDRSHLRSSLFIRHADFIRPYGICAVGRSSLVTLSVHRCYYSLMVIENRGVLINSVATQSINTAPES
jgi:hypothetical protein